MTQEKGALFSFYGPWPGTRQQGTFTSSEGNLGSLRKEDGFSAVLEG